jgi:hypothetical protein
MELSMFSLFSLCNNLFSQVVKESGVSLHAWSAAQAEAVALEGLWKTVSKVKKWHGYVKGTYYPK